MIHKVSYIKIHVSYIKIHVPHVLLRNICLVLLHNLGNMVS